MAYLNFQRGYIHVKIVYCGSSMCGKTANIEYLRKINEKKTELASVDTDGDITISLDYASLNQEDSGGGNTLLTLHTASGNVRHNSTWKMLLKDVDGIVFVADSQSSEMQNNIDSLRNLEKNLAEENINLSEIPLVFQYNKRELEKIETTEELEQKLNPMERPFFEASAVPGRNVKETLSALTKHILANVATICSFEDRVVPPPLPIILSPSVSQNDYIEDWIEELSDSDIESDQQNMDSWDPLRANKLKALDDIKSNKKHTSTEVEQLTLEAINAKIFDVLEKKLLIGVNESKEILQQMIMNQVEQTNIEDFRKEIVESIAEIKIQTKINTEILDEVRAAVDKLKKLATQAPIITKTESILETKSSEGTSEPIKRENESRPDLALELLRGLESLNIGDSFTAGKSPAKTSRG